MYACDQYSLVRYEIKPMEVKFDHRAVMIHTEMRGHAFQLILFERLFQLRCLFAEWYVPEVLCQRWYGGGVPDAVCPNPGSALRRK